MPFAARVRRFCLTMLAAIACVAVLKPAAADTSGCNLMAGPPVTLPYGASDTHSTAAVPLQAGERLRLRMTASPGESAAGTITLIPSEGDEQTLISGAAPQEILFSVPANGLYRLTFKADGAATVTFEIGCENRRAQMPSSTHPEAFVNRRAGRVLGQTTGQTSLRRRSGRPESLNDAIRSAAILDDDGAPAEVSVITSVQDLAAARGKTFAENKFDIWVEGRISQFDQRFDDDGTRYEAEAQGGTLYLGADYILKPGIMIGALVQLEQYREDYRDLAAATDSEGVMFGPYASVDLGSGLLLDAKANWGQIDNESNLTDGSLLAYETQRQLVRGQLSGSRSLFGLQLTPHLSLAMVDERFTDPLSDVDGHDPADAFTGRLGVGSVVSYQLPLDDGSYVKPSAGLSTGWLVEDFDALSTDMSAFSNDTGAKAEAGLEFGRADGVNISASGAVEGLGDDDYSAWTGRLSITAPLN